MKCPQCGTEQADDLRACSLCGRVLKEGGGPSLQVPSAPAEAAGQKVGKIILPDGVAPKPTAAGPASPGQGVPPTPAARPAALVFPTPGGKPPARPAQNGPAAGGFEMEEISFEQPKSDPKKLILFGVVLLGMGGYFAFRPPKVEEAQPPPVQAAPPPGPATPLPDPKVESCKQGLVDQGFLMVEAEAFCTETLEAWARAKQVQEARMVTLPFADPAQVMDAQIVPIKGSPTPEGRIRLYIYLLLADVMNNPCAASSGSVEVATELTPVERFPDRPVAKERFRRVVLPGQNQPSIHAYLGVMEFDPRTVAGQMMTVTLKFDGGRLEHQAVVSF